MAKSTTQRSTMTIVLAVISIGLVILAISLFTLDRLAMVRGRAIETVDDARINIVMILGILLVVAIAWVVMLYRTRGTGSIITRLAAVLAVLLLIGGPLLVWQTYSEARELKVVSMTCEADALKTTGGDPLAGCEEHAVDTIVLLRGLKSKDQWVPSSMEGNTTSTFDSLPAGGWKARLLVDGPLETSAVSAVADIDGTQQKIGEFRPQINMETGQLEWSSPLEIPDDVDEVRVLFYLSPNEVVPSAKIRFGIMACTGENPREFDASRCEPAPVQTSVVYEQKPEGSRTWRFPRMSADGTWLEVTNLEARTYVLVPDYPNIEALTKSTEVLIIPTAMPQTAENSIVRPGASEFEVEIGPSTGEVSYNVYIFPTGGPTYASIP